MIAARKEAGHLAIGAVVIAAVTASILELHHPNLAFSYRDGVDQIALINHMRIAGFHLGPSFVNQQMLGGFYGFNHWLSPSMWIVAVFGTTQPVLDASYVLCAAELYLSSYLLARMLGARSAAAAIGGLTLPLFILPLVWQEDPFLLLTFCPIFGDQIVINNLILVFLIAIFRTEPLRLWPYLLLVFCAAWFVLLNPLAVMLPVPLDLAAYIVLSVKSAKRPAFWRRQASFLGVLVLLLLLFGPFLFGLFANTSSGLFAAELTGDIFTNPWNQLPMPLKNWHYTLILAALLVLLAMEGRWWFVAGEKRGRLLLAIEGTYLALVILISAIFIFAFKGSATFPRPSYFDVPNWPFYFIVFGIVADCTATFILAQVPAWDNRLRHAYLQFAVFAVVAAFLAWRAPQLYFERIMPYRPGRDAETAFLQDKLVRPDGLFNGQVATFASTATNVGDLLAYDRAIELALGNAHRGETLRYFGIPTLDEYSALITPGKYLLLTRFFARRSDDQSRAMTVFTKYNERPLAALGVRYVVSDHPLPAPAMLRMQEAIPSIGTHFVYELPDANLGDYAPTNVTRIAAFDRQFLAILDKDFDFRTRGVTAEALPPLDPARSSLAAIPGGYRIHASSRGTSLLVLPVAYSHCMRWENHSGAPPRLIRVDFALTGVLFDHGVDGIIRPIQSPFVDPFCGIADWRDMRALATEHASLWPKGE